MANEQFESLIEAMPRIAEVVNAFESDALRERAMDSLLAAFGLTVVSQDRFSGSAPHDQVPSFEVNSEQTTESDVNGAGRRLKRSANRRSEPNWIIDRSISARPEGKESLTDFLRRTQPKNQNEQVLAIVYWLDKVAEVGPVTYDKVFTGFRLAELKVPGSLAGKISQTGSKTWLRDTKSNSVTLSVNGEDKVLHEMMKRPTKPVEAD